MTGRRGEGEGEGVGVSVKKCLEAAEEEDESYTDYLTGKLS